MKRNRDGYYVRPNAADTESDTDKMLADKEFSIIKESFHKDHQVEVWKALRGGPIDTVQLLSQYSLEVQKLRKHQKALLELCSNRAAELNTKATTIRMLQKKLDDKSKMLTHLDSGNFQMPAESPDTPLEALKSPDTPLEALEDNNVEQCGC